MCRAGGPYVLGWGPYVKGWGFIHVCVGLGVHMCRAGGPHL